MDRSIMAATPFSLNFYLAAERMAATLAAGVTRVRGAGGSDLGVKEAQVRGLIKGPSTLISISILSQTGGHGDSWQLCGADMPLLPDHPGRPSRIVAKATEGIKSAVRAGIRSIEHGIYLDDEAIGMMLEHGTHLVPTLVAPMGVLEAADRSVNVPQYAIDKTEMVMESHRDSVSRAAAAGVKVAMGTDSGVLPRGQNLRELDQMVQCGMSPTDALVASTRTAAELLGVLDDRGTLEPGKRADLVILDGDALDVRDLGSRIHAVIQGGRLVAD